MQSFVLDPAENPFNVLEPGKRPRVTLTPTLALKDGKPYLAFAVQGGDTQDQNLLQFFLNVVEFGMTRAGGGRGAELQQLPDAQLVRRPRVAARAASLLNESMPAWVRDGAAAAWATSSSFAAAHVGPDQRDLLRPRARHDVGRLQQPRRGLRHRLVGRLRSGHGFEAILALHARAPHARRGRACAGGSPTASPRTAPGASCPSTSRPCARCPSWRCCRTASCGRSCCCSSLCWRQGELRAIRGPCASPAHPRPAGRVHHRHRGQLARLHLGGDERRTCSRAASATSSTRS